jgi:hypothetical protein
MKTKNPIKYLFVIVAYTLLMVMPIVANGNSILHFDCRANTEQNQNEAQLTMSNADLFLAAEGNQAYSLFGFTCGKRPSMRVPARLPFCYSLSGNIAACLTLENSPKIFLTPKYLQNPSTPTPPCEYYVFALRKLLI